MNNTDFENINQKLIDEALAASPEFSLPMDFAEKVTIRAQKRLALREYLNEFIIYFSTITGILAIGVGIYLFTDENWKNTLQVYYQYLPFILAGLFFIIFLLFADKVILKYFLNHRRLD